MSALTDEIVDKIKGMSVLELSELSKQLQDVFGVSPAMSMAAMPMPGPAPTDGGAAVADDLPTAFDVILTAAGEKRLGVIKIVREITGQGLKESKDLVEGVPSKIKEGLNREDADALKAKFEAEGATVEVKPAG